MAGLEAKGADASRSNFCSSEELGYRASDKLECWEEDMGIVEEVGSVVIGGGICLAVGVEEYACSASRSALSASQSHSSITSSDHGSDNDGGAADTVAVGALTSVMLDKGRAGADEACDASTLRAGGNALDAGHGFTSTLSFSDIWAARSA